LKFSHHCCSVARKCVGVQTLFFVIIVFTLIKEKKNLFACWRPQRGRWYSMYEHVASGSRTIHRMCIHKKIIWFVSVIELSPTPRFRAFQYIYIYYICSLSETGTPAPYNATVSSATSFQSEYFHRHHNCTQKPVGTHDVRDRLSQWVLSALGVGSAHYKPRGWQLVYFAKRARLTNRTEPPSHTSSSLLPPSLFRPVHRYLFVHKKKKKTTLSLIYTYVYS